MGKKGRRCKTRWRRLPMGGDRAAGGDEAEDEECFEEGGGSGGDCHGRCSSSASALGGRERAKGGGSDGAASPQQSQNGPRQASLTSAPPSSHHAPYKGQKGGRGSFNGRRNGGGGAAVTEGSRKGTTGGGGSAYTFNEEEYTKITTPRQDVLFKKGYLMARKKDAPVASTNGSTPSSTEATNGEVTANGTSGTQNGDASSSSDQTYSAHVSGSGAEDENGGCNGYAYVNGYTNGYSYGGGYHMDQSGAVPNGGAYYVNGGSYELYDPYAAMAAAAGGYAFPYVGAPPPHPPPPHTIPPLQAIDWYASRPPGSTGDVQWCHLVASPGYSETRRKRYSTDSQNCSPLSSESTGPPGSPQEEAVSSSGGDPCHIHQPIPQYHHAHVFQGPHPHAAAYVYPGYLFGPAVYSVNGVPLAATSIHPLHGLSQSIHVHPSAAVAAPGPLSGHPGGVPSPAAPGSDGGSQRRRKKKRRRKRKRGLTDDASEETSSEVGEEEGGGAAGSGTCGACSGEGGSGNGRGEEFEEDEEEEDEESGPVVVVRLGNVVPLVMSQPQQMASTTSQPYAQADGTGGGEGGVDLGGREGEASSTDCSELSGHPESSSSMSGGEEPAIGGEFKDRRHDTMIARDESLAVTRQQRDEPNERFSDLQKGVLTRDAEVSAQEDLPEERARAPSEDKFVSTDAETREVWTQSPPEVGVQVGEIEPTTPPPSPSSIHTDVPEVMSLKQEESPKYRFDDNNKECSNEDKPVINEISEVQKSEVHLNPKDKAQEATKHGKRRNGRGKNNKPAVPVIHSIESPADEVQSSVAIEHNPEEVLVQEAETPEPVIMAQKEPIEVPTEDSKAKLTPVQEDLAMPNVVATAVEAVPERTQVLLEQTTDDVKVLHGIDDQVQDLGIVQMSPESVQKSHEAIENPKPVQKTPEQVQTIPEPVQNIPEPVQISPEPVKSIEKPLREVQESVQEKPLISSKTESLSELLSTEREVSSEPETKEKPVPPATLPLDTFTFKPEPYKYPTYKPYKKDKLEEPSLVQEVLKREIISEPNGHAEEEVAEEKQATKSSSPSRHLEDMPRRKARLKEPPEREEPPGKPIQTNLNEASVEEVVKKGVEAKTVLAENDQEVISLAMEAPDNKHQIVTEDKQPQFVAPVQNLTEEDLSKEESLTEVVSKWLEENSDALPESTDEIKGGEMKTEVAVEETEGEKLTGSKNGVRNPFPAPSNRSLEVEMKDECLCESKCVCTVNACVNALSGDAAEKRVAKLKFGGEDEAKTNEEQKRGERMVERSGEKGDADGRSRRGSTGEDEYDDQGSCEWEPMTVEPPKKGFSDLESWKRLRGSLGGSTEALKSLGSYRGTDDEDEDESRKTRQKMCDPTASVAKYYCLGAKGLKSPSPEEQRTPNKHIIKPAPAPTDSGVQTDEEGEVETGDSIVVAEEAKEDALPAGQRKSRGHKPVGLGRTAAFVVRQIGATESAKGPFPCGICCIIQ